MRKSLRFSSFLLGTFLLTNLAQSQSDRFAYAITDIKKDGANWSYLRKLDLGNGQFTDVLLNGTDPKQVAFDAITKKQLSSFTAEANRGYSMQPAFSSGVAAMAFDKRNNRLWYTPMFIDQLRYIDLRTMKVYYVSSQDFTGMAKKSADQGNIITRMTIGNDGNGYAMTNDGAHLLRFTTGKKITVTDLGMLADAPYNKGSSIHSACGSFGGDMIADNDGNLFVISAFNKIFKVNIETKIATHIGSVNGLPANFTTNGAAVTSDNKILLGSAVDGNNYYLVDPRQWTASVYQLAGGWRSSDLANSNILVTKTTKSVLENVVRPPSAEDLQTKLVQVYPNPVTDNQFVIHFNRLAIGDYSIRVTDVMGRQVLQRVVNVASEDQTETIRLSPASAKGFYLVNIFDNNSKAVFTKKLVVQ
ncbi:MAG TPA: T9SS type A sorting domain-containing protein [Chitinophagaceae bacterium]